jgi:hypothetical protein
LDPKRLKMDAAIALVRSPAMTLVLWSFLAGLALVLAALAFLVVRTIGLWRQTKATGSAFAVELAKFEERSARTERLLAEAERASSDLELALERLRVSRAGLDVLRSSLERSAARTRWLRALLPI